MLELRSVRGTGGGPERRSCSAPRCADRSQFAVTVCYLRDPRDDVFAIDERARGIGVDYVEVTRAALVRSQPSGGRCRTLVRDKRIDIIHAHDYKTNCLALLLAKSLR